jgi:hypothetical protein
MRALILLFALSFAPLARAETLADLAWLKGCWRTEGDGPTVVTEVWTAPPIPALLGFSYTIGEGEVQGWEQMRIEMGDGWPHLVAMPGGGAPVRFRLRETPSPLADVADFDNPAHDYPQIIHYQRYDNRLIATISRADGSDAITFAYRRIRCEAALRP